MRLHVDAACDIQHSGYYLEGFRRLLGRECLTFTSEHFGGFKSDRSILAMVLESRDGSRKRIVFDYGDSPKYHEKQYHWSDLYAKKNIRAEDFPLYPKSTQLGPGLPMKTMPPFQTGLLGFRNYLKARDRIGSVREFASMYKQFATRFLDQAQYDSKGVSESDYIHFVCTPWRNEQETNLLRANFMRAAKSLPGMVFDGGFAPRPGWDGTGFDDVMGKPLEPMEAYMRKTLRSLVVFNNPSVKGCHSWKLSEFLSWGKAIISTPLVRMLPAPLVDGVHLIYTDGSLEDMRAKISLLREDAALRKSLETNARAYFEENMLPEKIVSRVLGLAGLPLPANGR